MLSHPYKPNEPQSHLHNLQLMRCGMFANEATIHQSSKEVDVKILWTTALPSTMKKIEPNL